jgi:hypothetical protein
MISGPSSSLVHMPIDELLRVVHGRTLHNGVDGVGTS